MTDPRALLTEAVTERGAELLLPHLERVTVGDGEAILTDGVASSHLFLLVAGELAIVHVTDDGSRIDLGTRGPGSWLGEVGFVDGGPATATVLARGECQLLCMSHAVLVRLAHDEPEVASVLLQYVSGQLARRIAEASSGIVERVGPGQVRVHKPEEVRGWVARTLGWLLGGAG